MDQEQFKAMVKGTILEDAMKVDLADVVAPDDKVEDENAVLGVMSDLEKRFLFLAHQKRDAIAAICAECKKGDKNRDEEDAFCHQHILPGDKEQSEQIAKLMWMLIEMRLGSDNMSIRESFQIESSKNGHPSGVRIGIDLWGGDHNIMETLAHTIFGSGFKPH